jgi:hypothetical protein
MHLISTVCSQTFLEYLCIRVAHISYGQFIAICYKFKRSTYIQEPLAIEGDVCREILNVKTVSSR